MAESTLAPTALRLDVEGTDTAYRRAGDGPPLVFLHGLGLSGRWLALYDRLARDHDVIVPDHPGFGDSAPAPWMRDFDDLALHYAAFADTLGVGPFDLVGHSFGGWIAAEFAAFYPERVRTLTLITPLGLRVPGERPADLFRTGAEGRLELLFNGQAEVVQTLLGDEDPLEQLLQDYADLTAFGQFAWNPRSDPRLERRLARVRRPALVVGVDEDRVLPASHIAAWAQALPDARAVTVTGNAAPSGHGVVVQEPDAIAAVIDEHTKGQ